MRRGIHGVGRRCLQRIVANGGNLAFIKGGRVKVLIAAPSLGPVAKAGDLAKVLTPELPGEKSQEAQLERASRDAAKRALGFKR